MHFSTKCNSGHIAIQWFHIKHYLDYQYTKIPAVYLSGAKNVCFCSIRDFGSPTIKISNNRDSTAYENDLKSFEDICF